MKRLPGIVCAWLLLAVLAGCGGDEPPDQTGPATGTQAGAGQAGGTGQAGGAGGSGDTRGEQAPDPVLARVDDEEIRLSEFQHAFEDILREAEQGYTPDSTSARAFLRNYISKTIMEQIARDSVTWNPLLEHRANSYMENLMVHKMRYDAYGRAGDISDEQLRAAYELAQTEYHYRALLFPNEAEAQRYLQRIRGGEEFTAVAAELLGAGEDGDQGWQTTLTAPLVVIEQLRTLDPGEVGGPVEARDQWYLVQAIESRPNENPYTYEEAARPLRLRLAQDRATRPAREYREGIFEKYDFTPDPEAVDWFTQFFYEETKHVPRSSDLVLEPGEVPDNVMPADWSTCPLDDQQQRRIMATTAVDTIHAILLLDHFISQPSFSWPRFDDPGQTLTLLQDLALDRLERVEAWERGYDQHPEVAWPAQKRRNLILVRQLMRRVIRPESQPTMEQTRAWYQRRLVEEGKVERRTYSLMTLASKELAERARTLFESDRSTAEALALIQRIDPSATVVSGDGIEVVKGQTKSAVEEAIFGVRLHGVTEPHPVGTRYAIARVERITPGQAARPFEEVAEEVFKEYSDQRADSLLGHYIQERRAAIDIEVNQDVFEQVDFDPSR